MNQCAHCGSHNDDQAAFCNQCGGQLTVWSGSSPRRPIAESPQSSGTDRRASTSSANARPRGGGGRRGRVGFLLLAVLLAFLTGAILVTLREEEPEGTVVARPTPTPEDEPPAATVAGGDGEPASVETPTSPPPRTASEATVRRRVSALVSSALVILELVDDQARVTEQRGVLVDESGVVLCRFKSLIGARGGKARLLAATGVRTDILGLSFRDEAADLAFVRLAPVKDPFPWVPLSSEDTSSALGDGDQLYAFNDYRAIPVEIEARDYRGRDGVRRMLLGATSNGVGLPPQVFLVVNQSAGVIGLCRNEELVSPNPEPGVDPFRISVDEAVSLRESLHLPVGLTLEDLTERLYVGTFTDLYTRGRRAYRQEEWRAAIDLFEKALERVALDGPLDEEVENVNTSLRESYLREVDRLSNARRYRETIELAESAVDRYDDGPVLWRLLGEARLALDQNADGIDALLESRLLEPSRNVDEALENAYLKVAMQYVQGGEERLAELSILEGIEALPSSAELYIELARLHMRFEAYDDAIRLLEQARAFDATRSAVIDGLLAKIDDALKQRHAVVIPMTATDSIRALALVDGRRELNFIVDTGATYTAIPASVAEELDYDVKRAPRARVTTAGGVIEVPVIRMESISLGGFTVRNLRVLALPDRIAPGIYLLGLNYLNHFKYTVDAQRREFRIEAP